MNFSNYDYRSPLSRTPSANPSQLSSTPTNSRFLMPRFGYSSIPSYPRPRSSASRPNPGSYSEDDDCVIESRMDIEYPPMSARNDQFEDSDCNVNSMRNNFGSPTTHMDDSYRSRDNLYSNQNSFQSSDSSAYYSCNDTFSDSPKYVLGTSDHLRLTYLTGSSPFKSENKPSAFGTNNGNAERFQKSGSFPSNPSTFSQSNTNLKFQHSSSGRAKQFFPKKINPINPKEFKSKKTMGTKPKEWKCSLCAIEFTSGIPYEMHLRGAKHAKKIKTEGVLKSIKKLVSLKDVAPVGNVFHCDLCNVRANGSLQFQTHLEGTKHKVKVQQAELAKEKKDEKPEAEASDENEKTQPENGSAVRSLPSDFGEPQPAKLVKYSCDICGIIVNSEIQLQQHLISKKHLAKIEGKPLPKKKFQKKTEKEQTVEQSPSDAENSSKGSPSDAENSSKVSPKDAGNVTEISPKDAGKDSEVSLKDAGKDSEVSPNDAGKVSEEVSSKDAGKVSKEVSSKDAGNVSKVSPKDAGKVSKVSPKDAENVFKVPKTVAKDTKTVVGVKNLSSSFVKGETMQ